MPDAQVIRSSASRCQARPRAARAGYREDMLCASFASVVVMFHGVEKGVCRTHDASYGRWGADAHAFASLHWGWEPPEPLEGVGPESGPRLAPTGV
jgi:hypothetical protein